MDHQSGARSSDADAAWPKVTVLIPVFGAERTLERALASVFASDYPDFEVLAVDDGSTDKSLEILERFGVPVISIPHKGCAAARNRGIEEATGAILYFTDADIEIAPDTIRRGALHFLEDPDLSAVFGSYTPHAGATGFATAYKNYIHHYTHQNGQRDAWTFWTGCGFVRTEVARRHGGFDDQQRFLSDVEFGVRMHAAGDRVRLDPEIQVIHMKHYTLAGLLRSDFFGRAVPWSRLIMRHRTLQPDLNLRWNNALSVPVAAGVALASVVSVFLGAPALAAALLGLIVLAGLNRSFLDFVYRREGALFASGTLLVHGLIYLLSGLGVVAAICGYRSGGR